MAMKELGGSTEPRTRFNDDLIQAVNDNQAQGDEVVISLDANAVLSKDTNGLDKLLRECGLYNLAAFIPEHNDPPGTYEHSGRHIDYLIGTEGVKNAVIGGRALTYNHDIESDHRVIFVDF